MNREQYVVMCRVSGGYTGTREAPLKEGGHVLYFDDHKEAEETARKLRERPRPHSIASFHYWPERA